MGEERVERSMDEGSYVDDIAFDHINQSMHNLLLDLLSFLRPISMQQNIDKQSHTELQELRIDVSFAEKDIDYRLDHVILNQ